ncbi:MAG: nucleotidyl transferase AbiEii/AbiGii toxin family protein, partial [Agathobacter sp.]|nr:nucleotidyl transferase AbiEii/AbiGii toxin family protein [Agathobacter sp.]
DNYTYDVAAKIRHFYDLHYLLQDTECAEYLRSEQFKTDFNTLLTHDRETFDKPEGWNTMEIGQSPLLSDFPALWSNLKETYLKELPAIAFSGIPSEDAVAKSFEQIVYQIVR